MMGRVCSSPLPSWTPPSGHFIQLRNSSAAVSEDGGISVSASLPGIGTRHL